VTNAVTLMAVARAGACRGRKVHLRGHPSDVLRAACSVRPALEWRLASEQRRR